MQDAFSKLIKALTIRERGRFTSQPQKNSRGVNELEDDNGSLSNLREVQEMMTIQTGK